MSGRLQEVTTRRDSVRELRAVVTTMRGIAASRAQEGRAALAGIRAYTAIIESALGDVVSSLRGAMTARPGAQVRRARGIVVFCAEHGFAGAFSERLLQAVRAGEGNALLFILGSRGVLAAEEQRREVAWDWPMASHIGAVTTTAHRVAEELYARFIARELDEVGIVFTRLDPGSRPAIEIRRLLPLDLARFHAASVRTPPMTYLRPEVLIEQLIGEYFFAELAHAAMESFASENTARLETMSAARTNIDETLDRLAAEQRRLRQEEITAELLDMVTGSLAADRFI